MIVIVNFVRMVFSFAVKYYQNMRVALPIELSEQEHQKLLKLRNSRKTAVRLVERLNIILLAHEGNTNQEIARQLEITENKVAR